MTLHPNGTMVVGSPGSYARLLSELQDICSREHKKEIYKSQIEKIWKAGKKINKQNQLIEKDIELAQKQQYTGFIRW